MYSNQTPKKIESSLLPLLENNCVHNPRIIRHPKRQKLQLHYTLLQSFLKADHFIELLDIYLEKIRYLIK